jgi:chaperonin GroES
MAEKIRPLFDRVLIERIANPEKTQGGIIIPDTAQEKTQLGVVLAVGTGKILNDGKTLAMHVKVGDKVFFGKYAGTELDSERLIIKEDEILAIVED